MDQQSSFGLAFGDGSGILGSKPHFFNNLARTELLVFVGVVVDGVGILGNAKTTERFGPLGFLSSFFEAGVRCRFDHGDVVAAT
jgi:hypothetical protein